ncbi:hypothetical protein KFK09_019969 [Dendrobium nobile]|uniref:Uncharacterized protein n=1 Tax=Dendrobium nobile TaxID=94219 RepID=A0A8T3ASK6_DENNO|nr:hypothetical protein KFK09_019969 [Dendrobium nobile]
MGYEFLQLAFLPVVVSPIPSDLTRELVPQISVQRDDSQVLVDKFSFFWKKKMYEH